MLCSQCGFVSQTNLNFCGQCGTKLKSSEASQSSLSDASTTPITDDQSLINRFLTPQLSHKILATRGKIEGERRQVTALFVDIKGYTHLSETIGEEAIYRLMERMYEIMITAVYQEEGSVQKLTGDGIFALFGAPVALEDAPVRACRAGIAIQQKMKTLGDELMKEQNIRPLARVGIHTGPVVIGTMGTDMRMEFTALGDTVNLASRMESIAEPGSVYISEATHSLAGPYIESAFVGEKQVKGKSEPQKVYRVDGIKEHAVRFDVSLKRGLTPLVGRTKELEVLMEYCDLTCKGATLLVQIIGEPGVGKSRLVHELHNRIQNRRIFYLRANCMSFGQTTSFLPFIEIVKSLFRINDIDDRETVERKLMQGLKLLGMDALEKPFLLNLLSFPITDDSFKGLDAKLIGDRTREILTAVLLNQYQLSPTVLAIEDLHWIDAASEQLIQQILTKNIKSPLMLLCTTRPAYKAPWHADKSVKEVRLDPLTKDNAVHLIGAILGSEYISDDINKMIIDKTGCNPLFTEEMTRYLLDSGNLKKTEKESVYELTSGKMIVPTSILDLLQTRVDKLEEGPRSLLQIAAVIGQRFSPELVRRVSALDGSFDDYLGTLTTLELIFPEQVGGGIEYRFKHALLQDVIYDNLLKTSRDKLHQAVAETIERLYPDRLIEWCDALAHHWSNTTDAGKTVRYLAMAGEKSFQTYALEESHDRFKRAVELIDATPGCVDDYFFADILILWGRVYHYRKDFKGLMTFEKYLSRVEALGDKRRLSLFLWWLGSSYGIGGRGSLAIDMYERAITLGKEAGNVDSIGYSAMGLMYTYSYWVLDAHKSDTMVEYYYKLAIENADNMNDVFLKQYVYMGMAIHAYMRSRCAESRAYCTKLMELGRHYRDDRSTASALWTLAFCNIFEARYEEALENAGQSLLLSPDPFNQLCSLAAKGGALALTGKVDEGLGIMQEVRDNLLENGFIMLLAGVEIPLGAVMVLAGHMNKGVLHIKDAMKYWESMGNCAETVWGHVFLSDIYLQIAFGAPPPLPVILKNLWFVLTNKPIAKRKAKYHLEQVVTKSREYNMPGFLAKALYGLGTLAQAKKNHEEARSFYEEALKVAEESQLYIVEKVRTALKILDM